MVAQFWQGTAYLTIMTQNNIEGHESTKLLQSNRDNRLYNVTYFKQTNNPPGIPAYAEELANAHHLLDRKCASMILGGHHQPSILTERTDNGCEEAFGVTTFSPVSRSIFQHSLQYVISRSCSHKPRHQLLISTRKQSWGRNIAKQLLRLAKLYIIPSFTSTVYNLLQPL